MKQNILINTLQNNILQTTIYYERNPKDRPCVILVHGFQGFKDWGYVPFFAQELAQLGFFVITFNFSHNGIGTDPFKITELEKFANNTISLEVSELGEMVEFYKNGGFGFDGSKNKIGLIGHSRGGAIALIHSAEKNNVDALILWGTIATFKRYTKNQINRLLKDGFLELKNNKTNQVLKINRILFDDYIANRERFNLLERIKSLFIRTLIIHGDQDLIVPVNEAFQLYNNSNKEKTELIIIEGAGHTFNVFHPYTCSSPQFEKVKKYTISFLKKYLK